MSIYLVKQYQSEVEKTIQYGGTRKETYIRVAFFNLLNEYAKQKGLRMVTGSRRGVGDLLFYA